MYDRMINHFGFWILGSRKVHLVTARSTDRPGSFFRRPPVRRLNEHEHNVGLGRLQLTNQPNDDTLSHNAQL